MISRQSTLYIASFLVVAGVLLALAVIALRFREPSLELSRDCVGTTAYQDFDYELRVSGPELSWTERGEVSGGDSKYHVIFSDGMVGDGLVFGGQGYSYDRNEGWMEEDLVVTPTVLAHIGSNDYASIDIICPASLPEWVAAARQVGPGQFAVTASDGEWSYWVGDDGVLIRTASVDGRFSSEATIFNVGDPNVIERPLGV